MDDNNYGVSTMMGSAVALHEMYTSMIEAGFDEGQALYLLGQMIKGGGSQ